MQTSNMDNTTHNSFTFHPLPCGHIRSLSAVTPSVLNGHLKPQQKKNIIISTSILKSLFSMSENNLFQVDQTANGILITEHYIFRVKAMYFTLYFLRNS